MPCWGLSPTGGCLSPVTSILLPVGGGRTGSPWGGGLAALTPRSLQTSVLCKAAVHAGVVADEAGGQVTLSREKGITLYESAFANGLHSKRWAQGSQLPPPQCQSPPAGFCWVFALQDHS